VRHELVCSLAWAIAVTARTADCDFAHMASSANISLALAVISRHTKKAQSCLGRGFRAMPTLPQNVDVESSGVSASPIYEKTQQRRMLVALLVLLVALAMVIVKDRQFWFPSDSAFDSDSADLTPHVMAAAPTVSSKPVTPVVPAKPDLPETAVTKSEKRQAPSAWNRAKLKKQTQAERPLEPEVETDPDNPSIVATNRAVLPPLEVEVVAGDQHRPLQVNNPAVKVDMQSANASASNQSPAPPIASARVQLSPGTVEVVSRPVEPSYPLLAKQMKVQGAVVLEALIGKEGEIQDIQVLSGPAILSAAAREAVKQWRFRPYLQSGRAMETEARITVNFTISTY
jgi:TonB family protein